VLLSFLSFWRSSGLKEKNATSDPDISADPNSKISNTINPTTILASGVFKTIPENMYIYESGYADSN
jgi:hypothetical protein